MFYAVLMVCCEFHFGLLLEIKRSGIKDGHRAIWVMLEVILFLVFQICTENLSFTSLVHGSWYKNDHQLNGHFLYHEPCILRDPKICCYFFNVFGICSHLTKCLN